jgi:hypothetical protein
VAGFTGLPSDRTDPNEQESVVLLPELDALPHTRPAANVVELERARR